MTDTVVLTESITPVFIPRDGMILSLDEMPMLKPTERASLLSCLNKTRKGSESFVVEVNYVKQTDADPRVSPDNYQAIPGIAPNVHVGLLINAERSKKNEPYIRLVDNTRSDFGKPGYSTLRLRGLRSFRIIGRKTNE